MQGRGCWHSGIIAIFASALAVTWAADASAGGGMAAATRDAGLAARDEEVVRAAHDALNSGGYEALGPHLADVKAVLDRAPTTYPQMELKGDVLLVRSADADEVNAAADALLASHPQARSVKWAFNVYPIASLLLGAYANEVRQPQAALSVLDKGVALQPDDTDLIREKGVALFGLKRWEEALGLYERWLAMDDPMHAAFDRALLLRAKGFALIELERLDDAEAAYRASLQIEPDHGGAKYELAYIAKLRAGAERQQTGIFTYDKAKARAP